jgi:drug/metabolite transporter (DMT)-like permease
MTLRGFIGTVPVSCENELTPQSEISVEQGLITNLQSCFLQSISDYPSKSAGVIWASRLVSRRRLDYNWPHSGGIILSLSENSRGALVMALAMALFTCNDALVKQVAGELNIAQIMAVRGIMTTLLVYAITRQMKIRLTLRTLTDRLVVLRAFCELGATVSFFTALQRLDFSVAGSINQALPLAVTLGAAVFFGESVGWRRWAAIVVGLAGVLLIIRPGAEGFNPDAIYAVIALMFTTARDLTTRRINPAIPTLEITLLTAFANTMLGIVLIVPMGGWQPISGSTFGILVVTAFLVFGGYQTVIMAMRSGEVSFVAPFRYTSLIWQLTIAIFFFGEHPSATMLAGAVIVICSGLYTFYRENKRKQANAVSAETAPPGAIQTQETGQ